MVDMVRDPSREWPEGTPPGVFDISVSAIDAYPAASGHMLFVCPNGRRCCVLVGPVPAPPANGERLWVWGWDGNIERPTLTPSIDCKGCWHGYVRAGRME